MTYYVANRQCTLVAFPIEERLSLTVATKVCDRAWDSNGKAGEYS